MVYANNLNGDNSLAATTNPPTTLYANTFVISATGGENNLTATYIPAAGDPGFNSSAPTYLLSASTVPEPGTLPLGGVAAGLLGFSWVLRRIRQRA